MILDFLFPKYCLGCKKEGIYMFGECVKKVRLGFLNYDNYSIFRYEGVVRKAIISLKYKFAYDLASELINVSAKQLMKLKNRKTKNTTLIPISLHKRRENWRGFNQTEIIGEGLAKEMNWKYIPNLLVRQKQTIPQVGLKGLIRRNNLSGVFSVNPKLNLSFLIHDLIVIFDDVYTTGSTVKEAKKVLSATGFNNIKSLTIAR